MVETIQRTFTEHQVIQIVGFLTAELEALHSIEVPVILEATEKAMDVIAAASSLDSNGRTETAEGVQ